MDRMTPWEEYRYALENAGCIIFVIGAFGCLMAANGITLIICAAICAIGGLINLVAGWIVGKFVEKEQEKAEVLDEKLRRNI